MSHNLIGAGGKSVGLNIVSLLPKLEPDNEYLILIPKDCGYPDLSNYDNVEVLEISRYSTIKRLFFENKILPGIINGFTPDYIWGLGNHGLVFPPCKQGILIHQPHIVYPPSYYGTSTFIEKMKYSSFLKNRMKKYCHNTDMFFCQTPVMKKRFSKVFNFSEDKIFILPNAVSQFSKIDKNQIVRPKIFDSGNYYNLFFLSKFYGHKNPSILIDVFRKYPEELKDVRCLISMEPGQHPSDKKFYGDIAKYGLEKKIIPLGLLPQSELAGYFLNSDALFLHTFMESFSGTYLEAMHFGLPILTSDLDFARYVCGDAAFYFDPWSVDDVAKKIIKIKSNSSIADDLVIKGKERIPFFGGEWKTILKKSMRDIYSVCGK